MAIKTTHFPLLALLVAGTATALDFGNISVVSRLGQPFRAEIALLEDSGDGRLIGECFRIGPVADAQTGLPNLPEARTRLMRDGGRTRLLVSSDRPVSEPVVQFSVRTLCGPLQYRSYSVLLDPVLSRGAPPIVSARQADRVIAALPPSLAGKNPAASGPDWVCEEGESARSIAASIFPSNEVARRRFLGALLNANPDLALGRQGEQRLRAGTVLRLPETQHLPRENTTVVAVAPVRETPRAEAKPASLAKVQPPVTQELVPVEVVRLPQSPAVQVFPTAPEGGVRQPEQPVVTPAVAEPHPVQAAAPAPPSGSQPPVVATVVTPKAVAQVPDTEESEVGVIDWLLDLLGEWWREVLGVLGVVLLLLVWRSTKRKADAQKGIAASKAVERDPLSIIEEGARSERKVPAPLQPKELSAAPAQVAQGRDIEHQWAAQHGDTMVVNEESEFNPVMELAEIMLSFGRVKGAAQALQEYIDKSPNEALQPWMKLLEVYRQGDMRAEFENLTEKLKLHFNVAPADWDTMSEQISPPATPVDVETAPIGQLFEHLPNIARMTRIHDEITRTWDSPEGFDYLNTLLRDNRKGERQGFPLTVVSELLYLMDILEKRLKRHAA